MELLALNALILVPIGAYLWARSYRPEHKFVYSGIAFGLIVAPFSMGLYSFYFFGPPFGFVPGMVGLISVLFHGSPGYDLSIYFGLLEPRTVVEMPQKIAVIGLFNGGVWGLVYGCAGFGMDKFFKRRGRNNAST